MTAPASSTPSPVPAIPASAWSDREIDRAVMRIALFRRRGRSEAGAERLADRLQRRDREHDDRRCCDECARLRKGWTCADEGPVLPGVLQRCPNFDWQTS